MKITTTLLKTQTYDLGNKNAPLAFLRINSLPNALFLLLETAKEVFQINFNGKCQRKFLKSFFNKFERELEENTGSHKGIQK